MTSIVDDITDALINEVGDTALGTGHLNKKPTSNKHVLDVVAVA